MLNVVVFIIIGGEYTMHMVIWDDLSTLSQSDDMQFRFPTGLNSCLITVWDQLAGTN